MKQLLGLARLELFFSLKRSGFFIYYLALAALVFLFVNVIGGAFPGVQVNSDNVKINAPYFIQIMMGSISLLTTFVISSFSGMGALRDYRYQSFQITFTHPVPRASYALGKFLGIYLSNMLLFTAPFLGHALACEMPWLAPGSFLPFNFMAYWNVYIQLFAVNIFFLTAIFFVLGLLVRNIVVSWIAIIAFYILYFLAQSYFEQAHTKTLAILLDPYGLIGTLSVSVGQGAQERNTQSVNPDGLYLWNRLLWIGVGLLFLLFAVIRFRFGYQKATLRFRSSRRHKAAAGTAIAPPVAPPSFALHFGNIFSLKTYWSQLRMECRHIFKNVYFYIIVAAAAVFLFFASKVVGKAFEASTYPTTRQVLEIFGSTINIFIILLLLVFSGESVWRDTQTRLSGIIGSMPATRSVRFAAKTTALFFVVLLMMVLVLFAGLIFQSSGDYHQYQLPLYIQYLFGYLSVKYLFYCILAVALQSMTNNRFQGYAVFALLYIFKEYFAFSLLRRGVLIPGYTPEVSYSDLTGFQGAFYPFYIFVAYWTAFALLLWRAGIRLFPETEGESYKDRWKRLYGNGWLRQKTSTWVLAGCFVVLGCFIFYNTNILNTNLSAKEVNTLHARYEKQYARLRSEPQLSISSIDGNIDLMPSERDLQADIKLLLVNKTGKPVNNIYLNLPDYHNIRNLRSNKAWTPSFSDKKSDFFGYHFSTPVQPGDTVLLQYHFSGKPKGFTDQGLNAMVNNNGTFINSAAFTPVIGYNTELELTGNTVRKQYGLPAKGYAPLLSDPLARQENFFGPSADRIWLKLTISTDKGQTAIAPGYLKKQWTEGNRAFFTYEMDQPAINYFNILSGHYKVKTESFVPPGDSLQRPVQLSIYYHAAHAYNLDIMMTAMKDALTYYSRAYSPYQYRQLRIIEFPEGAFAQSFANTIAFSENMGFLVDRRNIISDSTEVDAAADFAYFVTVHEVAHQWWAHQILPAGTEGAQFLSETMSQYSAVMVIKEKYGAEGARKFLQHYSFEYLSSRGSETLEERPLKTVINQQYIYYAKGICAMYALQNYLGEETVNQVLHDFVHGYAFRERPYVTSDILVDRLKAAAPDSLKYLVTDCLERIILYDNKIASATYRRDTTTMTYTVDARIEGKKFLYDAKGNSKATAMNDWVEIGILNNKGKQVASQKVRLQAGQNKVRFVTERRPAALVLNPDFDLQEKTYNNDLRKVKVTAIE